MFELYREDNSGVRLDANTQTSSYLGKVAIANSAWTVTDSNNVTYAQVSVNLPAGTLFAAFGNTGGQFVAVDTVTDYGSYITYTLIATGSVAMTVYCFGERAISSGNCGLQLFDASETLVFDSLSRFMRVVGIANPGAADVPVSPRVQPGLLAAAYGFYGRWIRRNLIGGGVNIVAFQVINVGIRVTAQDATLGAIVRQGPPSNPPPPNTPQPPWSSVMMVDVGRY